MGSMQTTEKISVIIPSFHSKDLTEICIRSFKRFCPDNISLQYIVIENSDDTTYSNDICCIDPNVEWTNNNTHLVGSEANAEAIEVGLKYLRTDLVMLCHCDVCVTHPDFLNDLLEKYDDGYRLVGTQFDAHPIRIKGIHVSGLLTDFELCKKVDFMPRYVGGVQTLDVGDELTEYCRERDIDTFSFDNTYNDPSLIESIDEKYRSFNVDRCVNERGEVTFLHLGRGIPKTNGTYQKPNKVGLEEWIKFCKDIVKW